MKYFELINKLEGMKKDENDLSIYNSSIENENDIDTNDIINENINKIINYIKELENKNIIISKE